MVVVDGGDGEENGDAAGEEGYTRGDEGGRL